MKIRLAAVLVRNGKWTEAENIVTFALKGTSEGEIAEILQPVFSFVKAAAKKEQTKGALDILEQAELAESCRPLIEALRAVVAGTSEYFLNVAPEIRNAAENIYKVLVATDEKLQFMLHPQNLWVAFGSGRFPRV